MTFNIFTDLHHGDLYFSLHRLFEDRLGWNLYRPIGWDWFNAGWWKIAEPYGNPSDTINQYLEIIPTIYSQGYNLNKNHYVQDDVYYVWEEGHRYYQKAITLEKFKSMKFHIVMSSFPTHDELYSTMRATFQPYAKSVAHLGNGGQTTQIKNVITSVPFASAPGQNVVYVHQELDPDIYKYTPPNPATKNVYSMVNCLPYPEIYYQYKQAMPDIVFKAYGASSPEGPLDGSRGVGAEMRNANLGWQLKPLAGLGHTAMGWFMSGRPIVTNMSQNRITGGDALLLFQPGINCIDIETFSLHEGCKAIREWLEPDNNLIYGMNALNRFNEIVNYNQEEQNVRKWLERLI